MPTEPLDSTAQQIDSPTDDGDHARYVAEINIYEQEAQPWEEKSRKILRRYKDQRSPNEEKLSRFNIFWSSLQTLLPAVYAKNPKPNIERRHKDKDDLGRVTAMVLERTTTYYVNTTQFHRAMRATAFDRLTVGRGVPWARYEPHFQDVAVQGNPEVQEEGAEVTDTTYPGDNDEGEGYEPLQVIKHENVCYDHIKFEDFGHNTARDWSEVYLPWRRVFMTYNEMKKRFGKKIADKIPLNYTPKGLNDEKIQQAHKKAVIYELWDSRDKKVRWLNKDYPEIIETRDDPLGLPDFFPCPEPVYTNLAGDKLIPVPDYIQYQDQGNAIDELTSRIESVTKALKVAGVYAGSAEGIERLLAEGTENQMIPVDQWAIFAEKGGLKGVMEFLPIQEIAQALIYMHESREKMKEDYYEISGLSDIVRGATDPDETAKAQSIKKSFVSLRLTDMQSEIQRVARDMVRITAQIIAKHFTIDTIKKVSGVKLLTAAEKQQIQMQLQQMQLMAQHAQQLGQQLPPPPSLSEEIQEAMKNPTWEEVEQLLRDDAEFGFKIEIETDSTIAVDEEAERNSRMQFIETAGNMIQQAVQINNPALAPLIAEILMFGVRSFKTARPLEAAFEVTIDKLEKQASDPQQQKPDPEMAKVQGEIKVQQAKQQAEAQATQQELQARTQFEEQKMKMEAELNKQRAFQEYQRDQQEAQNKLQLEREKMSMEMAFQREKMQLELASKEKVETLKIEKLSKGNQEKQSAA